MLMTNQRGPAVRTLRGWATFVLQESGAIRECEEHGWMQDRTDPHARKRALAEARRDPPASIAPEQAVAEIRTSWTRSAIAVPSARQMRLGRPTGAPFRPGAGAGKLSPRQ